MPDLVALQPRQRAQQQVVVLRAVEALAKAADAVDEVARVEREMVDVVDARQQHVVERRLVEEIDGAQARVGDQLVGVEEPRRRVVGDRARDHARRRAAASASSWSMKPIQRPRAPRRRRCEAAAMPRLTPLRKTTTPGSRSCAASHLAVSAEVEPSSLSTSSAKPRRLLAERGEEIVEIGGGRVVERRNERDQRRRRAPRGGLSSRPASAQACRKCSCVGLRLCAKAPNGRPGARRREIGGDDVCARDRRAPRLERRQFWLDGARRAPRRRASAAQRNANSATPSSGIEPQPPQVGAAARDRAGSARRARRREADAVVLRRSRRPS